MIVAVVMLTTLSLLPHHHHDCSESAICMLPYDCEHGGECAHSHDSPMSEKEKCGFKLIDVSAIYKGEKTFLQTMVSIVLFFIPSNNAELEVKFSIEQLFFFNAFKTCIADCGLQYGLRAPPVIMC